MLLAQGDDLATTQRKEYRLDLITLLLMPYFSAMDFTRSVCQSSDKGDTYILSIKVSNSVWTYLPWASLSPWLIFGITFEATILLL
jgi:hypothetical protein